MLSRCKRLLDPDPVRRAISSWATLDVKAISAQTPAQAYNLGTAMQRSCGHCITSTSPLGLCWISSVAVSIRGQT